MTINYNYQIDPFPFFCFDAQNGSMYNSSSLTNNIIQGGTLDNTNTSGTPLISNPPAGKTGKTYTFSNPTNGFSGTEFIRYSAGTNCHFNLVTGTSAFVTFKNTSLLDAAAPTYFRQTPFAVGRDSFDGMWAFERFHTNSDFAFRYHFDQEGTYGGSFSIGSVPLNTVTQLGFVLETGGQILRVYKNGTQVATLNTSTKTLTTSALVDANLAVGAMDYIYGFIGEIYNATFWQTGLTVQQVEKFYENTIQRYS